jgi:hypothetical protein
MEPPTVAYETRVLHVAGAVDLTPGSTERPLLSALDGTLTVNAGADGDARPYVVIFNNSRVALPFVAWLGSELASGSLAPGATTVELTDDAGRLRIAQMQVGSVPPLESSGAPTGREDVVTLVLSTVPAIGSRCAGETIQFVGQAIGGRAP